MVKPMPVSYRHIAGVSLERLAALSDGIFAVAMTLLVLGLSVRANNALQCRCRLFYGLTCPVVGAALHAALPFM
jgi:uncharacterized membrane protein